MDDEVNIHNDDLPKLFEIMAYIFIELFWPELISNLANDLQDDVFNLSLNHIVEMYHF